MTSARPPREARRPARPHAARGPADAPLAAAIAWPPLAALIAAGAWALLLVLAPPARNAFWAANGLRSVSPLVAALLACAAALSAWAALRPPRSRAVLPVVAVVLAAIVAFGLHEPFHLLGDTASRVAAIADYANRAGARPLGEWAAALHAQPLDLAFGLLLTGAIARATHRLGLAVAVASFVLAVVFLAGAQRVAARVAGRSGAELPLWIVLVAWGGLEAFAGYAESAGVLLAAAVWWWAAMLAPIAKPRHVMMLVGAWLAVLGAHRIGLVLLLPQLARLLGPPLEGDEPRLRRAALLATIVAGVAGIAAQRLLGGAQAGLDLAELLRLPERDAFASLPADLLNLALLVAPALLLALLLAGREALTGARHDPRARLALLTAALLLPTACLLPIAPSGLGIQRDWDLSVMLGLSLAVAGALLLSRLPAARLRGALAVALPLLVLGAGGWVAVNADNRAVTLRARAMAYDTPRPGARQYSALLLMLGNRTLAQGQAVPAAQMLEESWRLVPSPARGLHACLAWYQAGDLAAAQRVLDAVRARGELTPAFQADADSMAARIDQLARARGLR